jgi:hypothetical protein
MFKEFFLDGIGFIWSLNPLKLDNLSPKHDLLFFI